MASEAGRAQHRIPRPTWEGTVVFGRSTASSAAVRVLLNGASPIAGVRPLLSRVVWECSPKWVVKLHLRLNTDTSPIADKYREGKLKRTLKREFKSMWNGLEVNGWDHKAPAVWGGEGGGAISRGNIYLYIRFAVGFNPYMGSGGKL